MNIPLVSFFSRASSWYIAAFMFVSNYLVLSKKPWGGWTQLAGLPDGTPGEWVPVTLFDRFGMALYVPALASVVMFVWMLVMHLFFRQTIDADTNDGTYLKDWRNLSAVDRCRLHVILRVGFFIGFCILCASLAKGADQSERLRTAALNPKFSIALDRALFDYKQNATRYQAISNARQTGVPPTVLFCLHQRESSGSFRHSLAQGDSLMRKSVNVPKNRIPYVSPPYTWEQCAIDAVYVVDRLDLSNWKSPQGALDAITGYNGWGYDKFHPGVPTPYLWSGTSLYQKGKYTGDGRFDPNAVDKQLGCVAILLRLKQSGIKLPWE
jgi:lysozyme family protein